MINNFMMSEDRKRELNFYIHNNYPIMITSSKEGMAEEMEHYNEDVYTISEMIFENFFTIVTYHNKEQIVTFTVNEDMNLFNGVEITSVTKGQRIDMQLDDKTNAEFSNKFFP